MFYAYWTHAIEKDGWIGLVSEELVRSMEFNPSDCIWLVPGTQSEGE